MALKKWDAVQPYSREDRDDGDTETVLAPVLTLSSLDWDSGPSARAQGKWSHLVKICF